MIEYLKIAVRNISQRKLRSWLTIIGVIIGIGAIISLISISNGMEHAITEQFESFDTDLITITPSNFRGPGSSSGEFTDKEVDAIRKISGLKHVTPMIMSSAKISFHNQDKYLSVMAYEATSESEDMWEDFGFEINKGRFPREGQGKVVGLGARAATDLFDDELHVRNNIYIDDIKFKVTGIADEIGNAQDDNAIFMPLDTAKELFNKTNYGFIIAVVNEGVDVDKMADRVEKKMSRLRDEEEFQVMTATEMLATVGTILGILQLVLVGIAGISLLVGAVGIMNTMYTSVMERTREIGVMKAIGATNRSIMTIFLFEAGIIGIIGGTAGAAIGTGIAQVVGFVASNMALPLPLKVIIEWKLIGYCIAFAFGLGALSGFLPARSAAKMKPADSLRYE